MTRTDIRPSTATRDGASAIDLHRDGTVTMWSCARQCWERGIPADADMAELSGRDHARVSRHVSRHA